MGATDDPQVTREIDATDGQRVQSPALDLALHREAREQREAADTDGTLDALDAVGLQRRFERDPLCDERRTDHVTRARASLTRDELLGEQAARGHLATRGPGMPNRHDGHDLVASERQRH